jgi:hypothetical protein
MPVFFQNHSTATSKHSSSARIAQLGFNFDRNEEQTLFSRHGNIFDFLKPTVGLVAFQNQIPLVAVLGTANWNIGVMS